MNAYLVRYERAMKRIGGAAGLLALPEQAKEALRKTNDIATKVKMLELIADAKEGRR